MGNNEPLPGAAAIATGPKVDQKTNSNYPITWTVDHQSRVRRHNPLPDQAINPIISCTQNNYGNDKFAYNPNVPKDVRSAARLVGAAYVDAHWPGAQIPPSNSAITEQVNIHTTPDFAPDDYKNMSRFGATWKLSENGTTRQIYADIRLDDPDLTLSKEELTKKYELSKVDELRKAIVIGLLSDDTVAVCGSIEDLMRDYIDGESLEKNLKTSSEGDSFSQIPTIIRLGTIRFPSTII